MRQYPAVLQYELQLRSSLHAAVSHLPPRDLAAADRHDSVIQIKIAQKIRPLVPLIVAARARRTERFAGPNTGQHVAAEELPREHRRQAQFGAKGANAFMFDQA